MFKLITLLLTILLAIASAGGYLFLNESIRDGRGYLAEGQHNIDTEGPSLVTGKAELAQGKKLLADGKKEYASAHDNFLLVWADKLFNGGKGFAEGREKIAAGEVKVAEGQERVDAGQIQLDKGNLQMSQGREKLKQGLDARDACVIGVIVFSALAILLGFFWRRSILQTLKKIRGR
jgi:hypothetical protein